MRIYTCARELMSELSRDVIEMGHENRPKTYQNKNIEGNPDFITKELIAESYCLTSLPDPEYLFAYTHTREWADAEFAERISGKRINPGEAWKLNKPMWEEFLTVRGDFDYTYSDRMNRSAFNDWNGVDQHNTYLHNTYLNHIISLLKYDKDTRKAVLSIFDTKTDADRLDGHARIPCSMYYQFLIRDSNHGKQLNIIYNQRSCDLVGHCGDDIYLAWLLMEYIAEKVGVKHGYLFHQIGSLHVYQKDWWKLKTSIDELV